MSQRRGRLQLRHSRGDSLSEDERNQHQDIARSSYADMLHDDERNRAYDAAIRLAVSTLVTSREHNPDRNRFFHCCDIGTGSGLLSMMIVRAFLELNYHSFHVTAYEEFRPMAYCAMKVMAQNSMMDYITVVPDRSTKCVRQPDELYDLLVAELLDTELIGEDCLSVYLHAVEKLCSPICLFVPHKASIYILPVASTRLFNRQTLHGGAIELCEGRKVTWKLPGDYTKCPGFNVVDDLQVSQLEVGKDVHLITEEPKKVFSFIFNDAQSMMLRETSIVEFSLTRGCPEPPVVVMWWDITMYDSSIINIKNVDISLEHIDRSLEVLSCAPSWCRDQTMSKRDQLIKDIYKRNVWREHWIQGVYYMRNIVDVRKFFSNGRNESSRPQSMTIICEHNALTMWFELDTGQSSAERSSQPSTCRCKLHRTLSRYEIGMLNDKDVMTKLLHIYFNCVPFNDLPSPVKIVFNIFELSDQFESRWTINCVVSQHWRNFIGDRSTCVLSDLRLNNDCSFEMAMLRKIINFRPNMDFCIEPFSGFEIKCTQVEFEDLHRICIDIKECEGFDLSEMSNMVRKSSNLVDKPIDYHNLWQYNSIRLDKKDYTIFSSGIEGIRQRDKIIEGVFNRKLELPLYRRGPSDWRQGWALVFWTQFKLANGDELFSTGPTQDCNLFERMKWNHHCKQMVYFLHDHPHVKPPNGSIPKVVIDVILEKTKLTVQRAVDYN